MIHYSYNGCNVTLKRSHKSVFIHTLKLLVVILIIGTLAGGVSTKDYFGASAAMSLLPAEDQFQNFWLVWIIYNAKHGNIGPWFKHIKTLL